MCKFYIKDKKKNKYLAHDVYFNKVRVVNRIDERNSFYHYYFEAGSQWIIEEMEKYNKSSEWNFEVLMKEDIIQLTKEELKEFIEKMLYNDEWFFEEVFRREDPYKALNILCDSIIDCCTHEKILFDWGKFIEHYGLDQDKNDFINCMAENLSYYNFKDFFKEKE